MAESTECVFFSLSHSYDSSAELEEDNDGILLNVPPLFQLLHIFSVVLDEVRIISVCFLPERTVCFSFTADTDLDVLAILFLVPLGRYSRKLADFLRCYVDS
jgi:hypothetical protein